MYILMHLYTIITIILCHTTKVKSFGCSLYIVLWIIMTQSFYVIAYTLVISNTLFVYMTQKSNGVLHPLYL